MKKSILLLFAAIIIFFGCKKKEDTNPKTGNLYLVAINVEDGAGYSTWFNDGAKSFVAVTPPAKNASRVSNINLSYGESVTYNAELDFASRGKYIEIVVTKSEDGSLVFSDRKIDRVSAVWRSVE